MTRSLLVATDGSPAAQSALRYALDFAAALRMNEIACLCVHEEDGSPRGSIVPAVVGAEMALTTGTGGLMLLDQPETKPRPPADPETVLNACFREVTAAGLRFTPVCGSGVPSAVITDTAHIGEAIFLGRNSDQPPTETCRLGFTASSVLQSIRQTVVICPTAHARVERLTLVLAGGLGDAEHVARGATWAAALGVPVHIAVAGSTRSFPTQALQAAQRVLTSERLATSGECYSCRPEEYVATLRPVDMLVVARRRLSWVVQLWFGSSTSRIVERAPGPVAIIA